MTDSQSFHRYGPEDTEGFAAFAVGERTGRRRNDFLPLGHENAAGAALLSQRVKVSEARHAALSAAGRRRVRPRALKRGTGENWPGFLAEARKASACPHTWAVGFSTAANIAASLMFCRSQMAGRRRACFSAMCRSSQPPPTKAARQTPCCVVRQRRPDDPGRHRPADVGEVWMTAGVRTSPIRRSTGTASRKNDSSRELG